MMVSRQKLAGILGITEDTLRGWQDRHFKSGLQYYVEGKITLYDVREVRLWLKSRKVLKGKAAASESASTGRAVSTQKLMKDPAMQRISGVR